jgi:G:T-mismatch repair DNA endonuclease (very short patch repair protein)
MHFSKNSKNIHLYETFVIAGGSLKEPMFLKDGLISKKQRKHLNNIVDIIGKTDEIYVVMVGKEDQHYFWYSPQCCSIAKNNNLNNEFFQKITKEVKDYYGFTNEKKEKEWKVSKNTFEGLTFLWLFIFFFIAVLGFVYVTLTFLYILFVRL